MKPFLLVILFLLPYYGVHAQNRVQILRSDRGERVQTPQGAVNKLYGNVYLKTNNLSIRSDSALHYVDLNELRAYGNIQIDTERDRIWTDRLIYNTRTEISRLDGRVIINRDTLTLYSRSALYSFLTEIAVFNYPLRLEDTKGTLLAESGVYFSQQDSAVFRGRVQLADSLKYIEADSMFTNRSSDYYELWGNVYLHDIENNSRSRGDYMEADSAGRRLLTGNAIVERISSENKDTTLLRADRIAIEKNDTTHVILSTGSVVLWSNRYASISDTAYFYESNEYTMLLGSPITWYDAYQLAGNTIEIQFKDEEPAFILATGEPFAVEKDSLTGRLHQMKADTILIRFLDGTVSRILLKPEAVLLYHSRNDRDEPDGVLEITAEQVDLIFEAGDLLEMRSYGNPDGAYRDEQPELATLLLEGVVWLPEKRPMRSVPPLHPLKEPIPAEKPFRLPSRYRNN